MPEQGFDARHQMCERGRLHEGLREGDYGQCGQHGLDDNVSDGTCQDVRIRRHTTVMKRCIRLFVKNLCITVPSLGNV